MKLDKIYSKLTSYWINYNFSGKINYDIANYVLDRCYIDIQLFMDIPDTDVRIAQIHESVYK